MFYLMTHSITNNTKMHFTEKWWNINRYALTNIQLKRNFNFKGGNSETNQQKKKLVSVHHFDFLHLLS